MPKTTPKQKDSFRNSPFYFNDCHICETVSKAEDAGRSLSEKELRQAFAQAEKNKQVANFKTTKKKME